MQFVAAIETKNKAKEVERKRLKLRRRRGGGLRRQRRSELLR